MIKIRNEEEEDYERVEEITRKAFYNIYCLSVYGVFFGCRNPDGAHAGCICCDRYLHCRAGSVQSAAFRGIAYYYGDWTFRSGSALICACHRSD